VSRPDDNARLVKATLDRFGRVDIAVLNAGRGNATSIEETTDEMIESIFRLNVFALYYAARALVPIMKGQGSGRIVTVASMAGKLGLPYMNAYVAAKHAAVGFSNALRLELVETGVEATVVCPAAVATEWGVATEGGSMAELLLRARERARQIAGERGIRGRSAGGILTADQIADAVLTAIENPVPEIYTHAGTHEAFVEAAQDRAVSERSAVPISIAMREIYPTLASRK
jgi:short-subunit dehydrogenase